MNILSSIASNKTILRVALTQISGALEKEGISALVILRDPENKNEDTPGLDVQTYKERIGILSGKDLEDYEQYLQAVKDAERIEREEGHVHND